MDQSQALKIAKNIPNFKDMDGMMRAVDGLPIEKKLWIERMNARASSLTKYDRVCVGDKMDMIQEWEKENLVISTRDPAFPLQQGVIEYFPATELFFNLGSDYADFELYVSGDHELSFRLTSSESFVPTTISEDIKILEKNGQVDIKSMMANSAYIFACVSAFMLYYEDSEFIMVTKERKNASKKGKKGKGKRNVVRLTKRFEVLSVPKPERSMGEHREIERHTEGWTVRGHWRHCKNGKTVWVKPYGKGDLRKIQPKTYQV